MSEKDPRREGAASHPVHSISDAQEAASVESRHRLRSYGFKMGLRAVLMIAGAIAAVYWNIWVGVGLLAASAVLPWIAVVDANLIDTRESDRRASYVDGPPRDALTGAPGSGEPSAPDAASPGRTTPAAGSDDVIRGEWAEASSVPDTERNKVDGHDGQERGA